MAFQLNGINAAVGGTFTLSLTRTDMSTLESVTQSSGAINYNSDAATFANRLKNIDIFNKGVSGVSVEAFDASGNSVATSSLTATKFVWTVSFWNVRDNS